MAILRGRDPTSQDPGGEGALRCAATGGRQRAGAARTSPPAGSRGSSSGAGYELRAPAASGPLTGHVPKCGRDVGTPVCVRLCRGTRDPGTGTQFRTWGRGAESLTDLGHLPSAPHPHLPRPAPRIWITRSPSPAAESLGPDIAAGPTVFLKKVARKSAPFTGPFPGSKLRSPLEMGPVRAEMCWASHTYRTSEAWYGKQNLNYHMSHFLC